MYHKTKEIVQNKIEKLKVKEIEIKENYNNASDFASKDIAVNSLRAIHHSIDCLNDIIEELEKEYDKKEITKGETKA